MNESKILSVAAEKKSERLRNGEEKYREIKEFKKEKTFKPKKEKYFWK